LTEVSVDDVSITLNNYSSETDVSRIGDPAVFCKILFYEMKPEPPD
jgi:hypothetical protein